MNEMKVILIVNAHAGKQLILKELDSVERVFLNAGHQLSVIRTETAEQARRAILLAGEKQPELLVCCGGDGTLNQTVSCLLEAGKELPLGYIPAGTTNDFANSLGLPKEPAAAAERIVSGTETPLDLGSFAGKPFIYVASFGAFTQASYSTDQALKNTFGHLAYVIEGLKELPELRSYRLRAETAEGDCYEGEYLFGAVSNSLSFGGVIKLDPEKVDFGDGKLELTLVKKPGNLHELNRILFSLMSGRYDEELISFCSTRQVQFTFEEAADWSLDGEYAPGGESVELRAVPGAYRLRY